MLALTQVVVVAVGAWGLGRTLVGPRLDELHPALRFAMQTATGLLAVSTVVWTQMLLGVGRASLATLTAVMALIGGVEAWRWARTRGRPLVNLQMVDRVGLLLAALWVAWVWMAAMLPPTGIDELIYHLEVPRRVLEAGHFVPFTDNVYAFFPQGGDALLLLGLGVGGESAARLFHGLCALLTGIAVYGVARAEAGRTPALLGAAAYLTVPTGLVIASWAYVDHHFTLYAFLALVAVERLLRAWHDADDSKILRWAVLAGVMAGGAWSSKYTGLQLTLLLCAVLLMDVLRGPRKGVPVRAIALPAIAFLFFVPYLLRNLWMTGWPLYPFAVGPFELREGLNWGVERAELYLAWLGQFGGGVERSALAKLGAPVEVFLRARFNDLNAFDGVAGPVFLLAPLAWAGRSTSRLMRLFGSFALLYLVYWALTTTQVRFLLPVLPALAVLVAVAAGGRYGRWLAPVCAALVLAGAGLGVRQVWSLNPMDWWTGRVDRHEWMSERVVGYPLYRLANERLAPGDRVYLVNMRTFGYLFELPSSPGAEPAGRTPGPFPPGFRGDYIFQHWSLERRLGSAERPEDIDAFFRDRGISHLMIDERLTLGSTGMGVRERDRLVSWLRDRGELIERNPRDRAQSFWRVVLP